MAIAGTVASVEASASVTLTLTGLPVGYKLRVRRVSESGTRTLVRGTAGMIDGTVLISTSTMLIEDYEAPLLAPVSYLIEATPVGVGTAESVQTETVTIPHADTDVAWLKDPSSPQRNVSVMMKTAPAWARPVEQAVYRVAGRRNAVVLTGVRSGREGELNVWTRTAEERDTLHWLLDSAAVLLWQAAPGLGPSDMYVSVAQATDSPAAGDVADAWREWTLPVIEVDMPTTVGVSGSAGRTWQHVLDAYPTWQAVLDAYATWEDVLLNRPIGG